MYLCTYMDLYQGRRKLFLDGGAEFEPKYENQVLNAA